MNEQDCINSSMAILLSNLDINGSEPPQWIEDWFSLPPYRWDDPPRAKRYDAYRSCARTLGCTKRSQLPEWLMDAIRARYPEADGSDFEDEFEDDDTEDEDIEDDIDVAEPSSNADSGEDQDTEDREEESEDVSEVDGELRQALVERINAMSEQQLRQIILGFVLHNPASLDDI